MNLKIFFFLVFGTMLHNCTMGQNKVFKDPTEFNLINRGIPISKTEFDQKVSDYLDRMMNGSKFNTKEYIDMVRVYNTIGWSFSTPANQYRLFYDAFLVVYTRPAAKRLQAGLSKGMSLYSKKYNLYIGDGPIVQNGVSASDNSKFKVDTLK